MERYAAICAEECHFAVVIRQYLEVDDLGVEVPVKLQREVVEVIKLDLRAQQRSAAATESS